MKSHVSPSVGEHLEATFNRLRYLSREHPTPTYEERMTQLERLKEALVERQRDIAGAISADFGHRSRHETLIGEVFLCVDGIREARRHLRSWMQPERRRTGLPFLPARSEVRYQPKGVVGVISPWNYPLQLAIMPLAGAIAAGNRVLLKPSEYTPQTAKLLRDLLRDALGDGTVAVITGGPKVGAAFAALPFDHLLYTGSTHVGRLVMKAAAPNLTPVTLELGGKSPAIVQRDYSPAHAAERIVAGKLFNAGQTCIAPDYLLAPTDRLQTLVEALTDQVKQAYPTLAHNPDYSSIINEAHLRRLQGYLDDARDKGARIVRLNPAGETLEADGRKLAPHLLLDVTEDMQVMQEEIFGPLLPIVGYDELDEAIRYVNARPRPLALYYFDRDGERVDDLLERTVSGGVCVNDTLLQVGQDDLPFGGIGDSGMGAYHGRKGFETFSHQKSVVHQSRVNGVKLFSPPYNHLVDKLLGLFIR
jgi:coniferyl-aldehyde dehydrogenase